MKKNTWLPVLLAALVVVAVGTVLIAAETMIVKVKSVDGEEVSVDVNGDVETIRVDDLADGEQRTFGPEDHEIVVKRSGDQLVLLVDGKECGPGGGQKGAAGHGFAFVTKDGEHDCQAKQHRVVVRQAGEGENFVWVGDGEEDGDVIIKKLLVGEGGEDQEMIFIGGEEGEGMAHHMIIKTLVEGGGEPGEVMIKAFGEHGEPDRVRYRCSEDETEIVLKNGDATQDAYMCPVCGRAMEKVEARRIEVFVHQIEEEIEIAE